MTLNRLIEIIKTFRANTPAKRALLARVSAAFDNLRAAHRAGKDASAEAQAFIDAVRALRVADLELTSDADFMVALSARR